MLSKEERIENLKKANDKSHKRIDLALKSTLYKMLKTKDISEITVTDLITAAGVSRGAFYKHYYLLTDLLKDDLDDIIKSIVFNFSPSLQSNWLHIFTKVYENRDKLAIIYKAGLGITLLEKLNNHFHSQKNEDMYIIWNGIAFNAIYTWGKNGFDKSPEMLANDMKEITKPLFTGQEIIAEK